MFVFVIDNFTHLGYVPTLPCLYVAAYGWSVLDGFCDDGNDLDSNYVAIVTCQNWCRTTEGCLGFSYTLYGAEADRCVLKSVTPCDPGSLVADGESVTFALTGENACPRF